MVVGIFVYGCCFCVFICWWCCVFCWFSDGGGFVEVVEFFWENCFIVLVYDEIDCIFVWVVGVE